MPAPQTNFVASTDKSGYDLATLSDDEDDGYSQSSRSTWASASDATILGFADGNLNSGEPDESDWRVSRIGGLPSFPLADAPDQAGSTTCRSCRNRMPLVTQIYCPLEASSLERVVYVFACPRTACRKVEGSIRAFRANRIWKESPEEKARIEQEKKANQPKAVQVDLGGLVFGGSSAPAAPSSSNPFAATTAKNPFAPAAPSTNPFAPAAGPNPFAPTAAPLPAPDPVREVSAPVATPASTSSGDVTSNWSTGPSYPGQYISTAYEPASPVLSSKSLPPLSSLAISDDTRSQDGASNSVEDDLERYDHRKEGKGSGGRTKKGSGGGKGRADGSGSKSSSAGGGGAAGAGEGYEVQRVKGVDQVFLRFQERVSREGSQVVRYGHSSQPLAFSATSPAYKSLYPPRGTSSSEDLGAFDPNRLPACRTCRARCVFEYQLMPNLIAILNRTEGQRGTSAYLQEDGNGSAAKEGEGFDWATVWVFTCGAECVDPSSADKESWREESVLVEWEE